MTDEELAEHLNQTPAAADDLLAMVSRDLDLLTKHGPMSPIEQRLAFLLSATVKVLMVTRSKLGDVT